MTSVSELRRRSHQRRSVGARLTRRVRPVVVAALASSWAIADGGVASAACWPPPVSGVVSDPFRPPGCPWCHGNRGLEYRPDRAGPVRAVAAGVVTYSGSVAGTRYVVVRLASGWRLTYGRLAETNVARGDRVVSGTVVGTVDREFFFGVRVGDRYVDPARFLGRLVGQARLVPVDGSPPRAAPPTRLRCGE